MSLPPIKAFPQEWHDLFDWFESHPHDQYRIPAENAARAASVRMEFYRVRSAALKEPMFAKAYLNTAIRECVLEGHSVVFRLKDHAPVAELLRRSLLANGVIEERTAE